MTATVKLHHLVRRERLRRWIIGGILLGVVAAVALGVQVAGGSEAAVIAVAVVAFGTGLFAWTRRAPWAVTPERLAAHLNRHAPELEESAHLLLVAPAQASLPVRLQQRRVAPVLEALSPPRIASLRGPVLVLFVALAWLLAAAVVPFSTGPHAVTVPLRTVAGAAPEQLTITDVSLRMVPPAYTRRAPVDTNALSVDVPERAQLTWSMRPTGPVDTLQLVFEQGATVDLELEEDGWYRGRLRVMQSGVYRIEARRGGQVAHRSAAFVLRAVPDAPPGIARIEPDLRTVFEPGEEGDLDLRFLADDDYGLVDAHLVLTLAKGTGENVRFRELTEELTRIERLSARRWMLHHRLAVAEWDLEPGDELYGYVEVEDTRAPSPQTSRSETFFVVLRDTFATQTVSDWRLGVNPMPEYFRSQRQIIIDTEALLAEQPELTRAAFRERSNQIALDQKVLRLRYGQFLGEEFESASPGGEVDGETEGDHAGHGHDHDHRHGDEPAHDVSEADAGGPMRAGRMSERAAQVPTSFMHLHDTEEGATFYSDDVRQELKAALGQMWESELHLRLAEPAEALPFAYEALRMIKALQQKARIYVQRIGFEPPPLDPAGRRLTGSLEEVPVLQRRVAEVSREGEAATEEALSVLEGLVRGEPMAAGTAVPVLEALGRALSAHVIAQGGRHVAALDALRQLIDGLAAGEAPCRTCAARAWRGAYALLDRPLPIPSGPARAPLDLERAYWQALGD